MFERAELQKYLRDKLIDIDLTFILCELASKNSVELATITGAVVSASDSFSIGVVILPTKINNISELQLFSYELQKVRDAMKICIVVPSLEYTEHKHIIECLKRFIEIFVRSGLVNLDLADLSTIVKGGYVAAIGSCETTEEVIDTKNRVLTAINTILKSPIFLIDLRMCSKVLVNVTGGPSMTLEEAEGCARVINKLVPTHTRIIWGATIDTTIATGLRVVLVAGIPPEHALLQVYTRD
jgi:cell division protein FtsZ